MFPSLQKSRAIAALLVVCFHSAGNLAKPRYFGDLALPLERLCWFGGQAGVAFFFVLSGFIIRHAHQSDFNRPDRLGTYVKRRLVRIYPTYLLIFAATYVLAKLTPSLRDAIHDNGWILAKALILLPQDSAVIGGTGAPVLIVAWSLQYELFFYAVFALAIIRQPLLYGMGALIGVAVVSAQFDGPFGFPLSFISSQLVALFAFGYVASVVLDQSPVTRCPVGACLWSAALFIAVAATATAHRDHFNQPMFDVLYGAAGMVLITSLARFDRQRHPSASRGVLHTIGDASYGLYLLHFPLVSVLSKACASILPRTLAGSVISFLVLVLGSVWTAIAFHRHIEKPMLRWLSTMGANRRPRPDPLQR